MLALGPLVSNRIKSKYQNIIYKKDTEEAQLVFKCLSKLIDVNFLSKIVPTHDVKVLHNDGTLGLFMSFDHTLFVTIATLKLA